MRIGVPKEIKNHEYRVGLVPAGVRELVAEGHEVFVQASAGAGIGVDYGIYLFSAIQERMRGSSTRVKRSTWMRPHVGQAMGSTPLRGFKPSE